MLEIIGNRIRMTRGDSAYMTVKLTRAIPGCEEEEYTMAEDDTLTMTVRKNIRADTAIIKTAVGSASFRFVPSDTEDLSPGCYIYDVQLTTAAGDVYTVTDREEFILMDGVTR